MRKSATTCHSGEIAPGSMRPSSSSAVASFPKVSAMIPCGADTCRARRRALRLERECCSITGPTRSDLAPGPQHEDVLGARRDLGWPRRRAAGSRLALGPGDRVASPKGSHRSFRDAGEQQALGLGCGARPGSRSWPVGEHVAGKCCVPAAASGSDRRTHALDVVDRDGELEAARAVAGARHAAAACAHPRPGARPW